MLADIEIISMCIPDDDDGSLVRKLLADKRGWKEEDVIVTPIKGGFVNRMTRYHHIRDIQLEDAFVVRHFQHCPGDWGCRELEFAAAQLAHHANCFPRIYATLENAFIYKYAHGVGLTDHHLEDPVIQRLVARCVAQLHSVELDRVPLVDIKGNVTTFPKKSTFFSWMYNRIDGYAHLKPEPGIVESLQRAEIPTADVFREELRYIESMLDDLDLPHGLCHRDVHGRNMAYDEAAGTLTLFDYESAIYGILAFDLAFFLNIFLYKDFHVPDFPTGNGPASEKTKRFYVKSYLERRHELQGYDPEDVTEYEIDLRLTELNLLDAIVPFSVAVVLLGLGVVDGKLALAEMGPGLFKEYYERKPRLATLRKEYLRLKAMNKL